MPFKRWVTAYWPLQDFANTNFVWCMPFKRCVGGGSYVAQSACNSVGKANREGQKKDDSLVLKSFEVNEYLVKARPLSSLAAVRTLWLKRALQLLSKRHK